MQYTTVFTALFACIASAQAQYNGTWAMPTGTAVGTASGSMSAPTSTGSPIMGNAAVGRYSGSALGLVIAGGVALAL